jgi:hypothetical protein
MARARTATQPAAAAGAETPGTDETEETLEGAVEGEGEGKSEGSEGAAAAPAQPPAPPATDESVPTAFSTKVTPKVVAPKPTVFSGKLKAKTSIRSSNPAAKDGFIEPGTVFTASEAEAAHLLKLDAVELV